MFAKEVAAGGDLVDGGLDGADVGTEGRGNERTADAGDAGDELVGGHFGGGPVELEEAGVDVIIGSKEEVKGFEAKIGEGDAEVEIVELVEAEEHSGNGAIEDEEELAGVFGGLLEVKAALGDVDFGKGADGFENIPLSVGNELNEGDGEAVLRTELKGVTEAEEENEERADIADKGGRVVLNAVGEIEAEAEFFAVFGENDEGIECHDGASDGNYDDLVLSNEGGADKKTEIENVEGERVAVGAGVLIFVVELLEDEGEDGLDDEDEDGVDGKSTVNGGVHVHELDEGVDVENGKAID